MKSTSGSGKGACNPVVYHGAFGEHVRRGWAAWVAGLIVLSLGSSVQATCSHPAGPLPFGVVGDANNNGVVNIADAMCAVLTAFWQSGPPLAPAPGCLGGSWKRADVDCSGQVNVVDVTAIVTKVLTGSLGAALDPSNSGCAVGCAGCAPEGGGSCLIGGCVPEGQSNPQAICDICSPGIADVSYSAAPQGWPCGGGKICSPEGCVSTVPGAPSAVGLVPGRGELVMSFEPPLSNGGSAVLGYRVSCTSGQGTVTQDGVGSPIAVTGLVGGTSYSCSVLAWNAVGESSASGALVQTPTSCSDGLQNGPETGVDCGGDCPSCSQPGGAPDNPAVSCLAIAQAGNDQGNGLYWIQLNSGVVQLYCHFAVGGTGGGTGWTRVGALDGGQDYCVAAGTTDLRVSPEASAGKIPDSDVHGLFNNTPGSPRDVMFFVRDNNRWVWHALQSVADFNTQNKHSSSSYYCSNWNCFGGGTDGSSCGSEGNGCPVTAHGHSGGSKKIYVDSGFSAHNRGLHYNGSICGEPNYSRASIWVLVR